MKKIRLRKDDAKSLPACNLWGSDQPVAEAAQKFELRFGWKPRYCYMIGKLAYFPADQNYAPGGAVVE